MRVCYIDHPQLFIVSNKHVNSFADKINLAKNVVLETLFHYKNTTRFHRKLLLRNSKGGLFDYFLKNYSSTEIQLENTDRKSVV